VQVGAPAAAFATIINHGASPTAGCRIEPSAAVSADFLFQTTDPQTNALAGTANAPVGIPAASQQSFAIAFTPTAAFPPAAVPLTFRCDDAAPAPTRTGLNDLLLSASTTAVPDVIALAGPTPAFAGTPPGALQINIPPGTEFLVVAAANVGSASTITVSVDTGDRALPLVLGICQSDPGTGVCLGASTTPAADLAQFAPSVTLAMGAGATSTFIVAATQTGPIAFDPANHRVFIRFTDASGVTRGATSVAVSTSP
jgi:hypothetical protein